MNNPFRIKSIRRAVLDALLLADTYALPESTLRTHVGDIERPQPTDKEWTETTDWLAENGLIVAVPNGLDETLKQWAITERGRTVLATL